LVASVSRRKASGNTVKQQKGNANAKRKTATGGAALAVARAATRKAAAAKANPTAGGTSLAALAGRRKVPGNTVKQKGNAKAKGNAKVAKRKRGTGGAAKKAVTRAASQKDRPPAPLLPPHGRKHLLVLDLDETLVHSAEAPLAQKPHFTFKMGDLRVDTLFRPGLRAFLNAAAALFDICIFTASRQYYAEPILNFLDPDGTLFKKRLFRHDCNELSNGGTTKDVSALGRELDHVIIIDNKAECFSLQPENGAEIPSWYSDESDDALDKLLPHLRFLASQPTVYGGLKKLRSALGWTQ
jgi:RNA polymerase II subunit A small phosphatase-like protein